jgi:catechol 2,3-dioxygenase-like lactoylglutathione lyase family enzyme
MPPRMNQIALSVVDREVSSAFYRDVFGLPRVGGTRFTGAATEKVQGLPGATSDVAWHMDDREFFQLELFQFETPAPRAYAALRKPWDIGYSRLAVEVADPVGFHAKCTLRSVPGLSPLKQVRGKPYFVLRDPRRGGHERPQPDRRNEFLPAGDRLPDPRRFAPRQGPALG